METEIKVPKAVEDQIRVFLRNLSDAQVSNILYIIAEWQEEFVQYCYEHEGTAVDKFAEMLADEEDYNG